MPNGGEHFEHVGMCPHCDNYRIRTRKRKHAIQVWRCRRCNKTFATPRVVEVAIGPNTNTRGLIFADRIKRMERRARLPMRKPRFSALQALAVVAVIAVLAVGVWYFTNLSPTSAGREKADTPNLGRIGNHADAHMGHPSDRHRRRSILPFLRTPTILATLKPSGSCWS